MTEVTPLTSRIVAQQASSLKPCEGTLYPNGCRWRKLRKTHAKRNGSSAILFFPFVDILSLPIVLNLGLVLAVLSISEISECP